MIVRAPKWAHQLGYEPQRTAAHSRPVLACGYVLVRLTSRESARMYFLR